MWNVPLPGQSPLIIGIAGGSGSGKSTVSRKLADALPDTTVARIEMDWYYRDFSHLSSYELHHQVNWDHPESFDLDLLAEHLMRLKSGSAIDAPVFEYATHARSDTRAHIPAGDVILVDGILLFADERLRDACDVKVFVEAAPDVRLSRRIQRDMTDRGRSLDSVLAQYHSTVQPMHQQFVEPTKRYADVIVPRGGSNVIAIEMLAAMIQRRLREAKAALA